MTVPRVYSEKRVTDRAVKKGEGGENKRKGEKHFIKSKFVRQINLSSSLKVVQ